ncbi:MAG: hypothetical protein OHK005_06210 [Candidatus Methylacidiphilales bacterium]
MKRLGWVLAWLGATICLSAVLTPLAVWLVEAVAPGQVPVRRIFNRCLLGSALLLGWPFLRHLGIRSWRDVGWSGSWGGGLQQFGWGALGGMMVFGGLWLVAVMVGGRTAIVWPGWGMIGWSLLFALLVGLIEETVFRGVLFLALVRDRGAVPPVAVVNAVLFASVHFFKAPDVATQVTWTTGFEIWAGMLAGAWMAGEALWRWGALAFLSLAMAGLVWRSGRLWSAAGAHAGLVLAMKLMVGSSTGTSGIVGALWGSDGISGPVPLVAAALGAVWIWRGKWR